MKTFEDLKQEILSAKSKDLVLDLWIYKDEIIFYLPKNLEKTIPELVNYITTNFKNCRVVGYKMTDDHYSARVFVERLITD